MKKMVKGLVVVLAVLMMSFVGCDEEEEVKFVAEQYRGVFQQVFDNGELSSSLIKITKDTVYESDTYNYPDWTAGGFRNEAWTSGADLYIGSNISGYKFGTFRDVDTFVYTDSGAKFIRTTEYQ